MDNTGLVRIAGKILISRSIPVPSEFSLELIQLVSSSELDQDHFSNLILQNNDLTELLIRYTNLCCSENYFDSQYPKKTVEKLGVLPIAGTALLLSLLSQSRQGLCTHFDYQHFWQKSLAQGLAAVHLARKKNFDTKVTGICAIFRNLGELVLASSYPDEYGEILKKTHDEAHRTSAERLQFGINSIEMTWAILSRWNFPRPCLDLIRQLAPPLPMEAEEMYQHPSQAINLAGKIAEICLLEAPLTETFVQIEKQAEDFSIPVNEFGPFFDNITTQLNDLFDIFNLPSIQCPQYHQIKVLDDMNDIVVHENQAPLTFLAVDDDPTTLFILKKMLKSENRKILTAKNGEQALGMALEHRPHLLITDWIMPKLNGLDLCKILRKTKVTQHMYIIMLTARENDEEVVKAFEVGANDYIVKPFTPKILHARITNGERLIHYQLTINKDREIIQRYATELASANRKLQNMAMTDFLTGLPNRRSGFDRLRNLVAEAKRYGESLSCLMIDVDHFKEINDTYGHDFGDLVLKQLSKILEEKARSYDMVSRWGGEEFLIISARSTHRDSINLAERLRQTVEESTMSVSDQIRTKLTISIGVATWVHSFKDENELLKEADKQLYTAKTLGRNRVEPGASTLLSVPLHSRTEF